MIDVHSHSNNSPDGDDSVKLMCDTAVALGLTAYCITDHFEANYQCENSPFQESEGWDGKEFKPYEGIANLVKELDEYRQDNKGIKTNILAGIELGQPLQGMEHTNLILSKHNFDFVMFSLHNVKDRQDFYWIDYSKADRGYINDLVAEYYTELLHMVQTDMYDSVGHLTYPKRYAAKQGFGDMVNLSLHDELIEQILKTVISKNKAIEINTSGLRGELNELMPNEKYLRMYHDLGGVNLTIGSDSHNTKHVGDGISQAIGLAKSIGFSYVTYYEKRSPVMLKI